MVLSLLYLPIFLILYALVIYFCVRLAKKLGYSKRVLKSIVFFFIALLFVDAVPGFLVFKHICTTQAGYAVFKEVRTDGYAYVSHDPDIRISGAKTKLTDIFSPRRRGYFSYVETEVTMPRVEFLADKVGKYRFTLRKRNHPSCKQFEGLSEKDKNLLFGNWSEKQIASHVEIVNEKPLVKGRPQNLCIGVEYIDRFKSRYLVVDAAENRYMRILGIEYRFYRQVFDRQDNMKLLSHHLWPVWHGGWFWKTFFNLNSHTDHIVGCNVKRYKQEEYIPRYWHVGALRPINKNSKRTTD